MITGSDGSIARQRCTQPQAVRARQAHVGDDDAQPARLDRAQAFLRRLDRLDAQAGELERLRAAEADVGVVLDDEHLQLGAHVLSSSAMRLAAPAISGVRSPGSVTEKRAPPPGCKLATSSPWNSRTMSREIVRPRPSPAPLLFDV